MNFRPELAAAVMAGAKTVTRRLTSTNSRSPWWVGGCSLQVGRDYAICPGRGKDQIGRALVLSVRREPLGFLSAAEAELEGFGDARLFEDAWIAINGSYDPDTLVWRIALEAVPA